MMQWVNWLMKVPVVLNLKRKERRLRKMSRFGDLIRGQGAPAPKPEPVVEGSGYS